MSPRTAALTHEQHRLRQRQDEVRLALASANTDGRRQSKLSELNASVFDRLREIRGPKRLR
jgi:hypothetical protein